MDITSTALPAGSIMTFDSNYANPQVLGNTPQNSKICQRKIAAHVHKLFLSYTLCNSFDFTDAASGINQQNFWLIIFS